MAGNRDRNPFDQEDEVNSYSNPPQFSHSKLPAVPERATYNYDRNPAIDITLDKARNLEQKERELQAREADLRRREEEFKKKEEALARAGVFVDVKNWPPFFPIIHHEIANEIPSYLQRMQFVAFATFLGLILCLFWNLIAVSIASLPGPGLRMWFPAVFYFVLGVPGSYLLWYRPLYRACREDSAVKLGWFFMFYMIHICFCLYALVAPPLIFPGSLTGCMSTLMFPVTRDGYAMVMIFYFIGWGLFFVETVLSIWVFQKVYRHFRGAGNAAEAAGSAMAAI